MKKTSFIILISAVIFIAAGTDDKNPYLISKGSGKLPVLMVTDQKLFNLNNISTWYRNNGSYNRSPISGNSGFEWPKGSNKFARYASGLWLGGKLNGQIRVALADYDYEFLSGYTDNNGVPQGKDDPLYRIYQITAGINDQDRQLWPNVLLGNSNQGAPVYFDPVSNSWKPLDYGGMTMFYRYTDSYPEAHGNVRGSTLPLKADIIHLNYGFASPAELSDVIFTELRIINRSGVIWDSTYICLWSDDDIGSNFRDDLVGCDSSLQLGYTYKANPSDPQYQLPPAVGFLLLKGAEIYTGNSGDTVYWCEAKNKRFKTGYRNKRLSSFITFNNADPTFGDPVSFIETYNYMKGLRKTGAPIFHPNGYATKFMFPGNPETFQGWLDPTPNDKRFLMSIGPLKINPNDTQRIVFAQLIAQGVNHRNSVTKLKQLAQQVIDHYNNCFAGVPISVKGTDNRIPVAFRLHQNYPNPFNPETEIKFEMPVSGYIKLSIYDVSGREVSVLAEGIHNAGVHSYKWNAENYSSGIYFCRLEADGLDNTMKMVLIR